jgi:geranylgeranyl reductase family protein
MAACCLARTGRRIVILEKTRLPRRKACGGAIPSTIKTLFDWDISPFIDAEVMGLKYLFQYERPKIVRLTHSILMVRRDLFDFHLIEKAVSIGKGTVALYDQFRVIRVEEGKDCVRIYGHKQETIEADFVIGADGASSITAKSLGLNQNTAYGMAIDAEVRVTPNVFDAEKEHATLNYSCLPKGYGWIFPKKDFLSCGVGSYLGQKTLANEIDLFLRKSFPPGSIRSVKRLSHPVPLYSGHKQIATRRVCLVGDAANLVHPISGEGIRYALQSGSMAADVLMGMIPAAPTSNMSPEMTKREKEGCHGYQEKIHQTIGNEMHLLYKLALPIFMDAPEFFYRKFVLGGSSYTQAYQKLSQQLKSFGHFQAE